MVYSSTRRVEYQYVWIVGEIYNWLKEFDHAFLKEGVPGNGWNVLKCQRLQIDQELPFDNTIIWTLSISTFLL